MLVMITGMKQEKKKKLKAMGFTRIRPMPRAKHGPNSLKAQGLGLYPTPKFHDAV
jgi:hypothetical protein